MKSRRAPWLRRRLASVAVSTYDHLALRGEYGRALEDLRTTESWAQAVREKRLRVILEHATRTVPFYENLALDINDGLPAFPVVSKEMLRHQGSAFESSVARKRGCIWITTSGSTGVPLRIRFDRAKLARRTAEIGFFNGLVGYRLGDRHTYHSVWSKKGVLRRVLQNQRISDPTHLDSTWLEREVWSLRKEGISFYVGNTSALRVLAATVIERGLGPGDFALRGIVVTSERLDSETRSLLSRAFGCTVVSRYSSLETGVLAQECGERGVMHWNDASYYVEILDANTDQEATPGTVGRVVVTDLFARATPLIRYDIGDLATAALHDCVCNNPGLPVANVEGRVVENVTDSAGRYISWSAVSTLFWQRQSVESFQFIQLEHGRYEMLVTGNIDQADIDALRGGVYKLVGDSAEILIRRVATIPTLPSGKRQYIVNRSRSRRSDGVSRV